MVKRKIQKIFGFSCFKASEDMISSSLPSMGGERDKGGGGGLVEAGRGKGGLKGWLLELKR